MKMKTFGFIGMALTALLLVSCSENDDHILGNEEKTSVITTRLASFAGEGQSVSGEEEVKDLQACLFQNGVLTEVYKNLQAEGNFTLNSDEGHLYMLANTEGVIDLDDLRARSVEEENWKQTVIGESGDKAVRFFSGMLDLQSQRGSAKTLTLTRGVARFDIRKEVSGNATIKSLTLTNVAKSGYLFSQEAVKSPVEATREDVTVSFSDPLEQNTSGVLYVYEQTTTDNMKVQVEVQFNGESSSKTLEKTLSGNLERNHIYTVVVRKGDIQIVVTPTYEEWETGGDIELSPEQ